MGTANYISQLLTKIKKHIDNNILIVEDLNTPLSATDRSSKQKINKETRALNDTLDQMDLIDIYRIFHLKTTEYSFFLKRTWNFLQNTSHTGSQIRSQPIPKD